MRQLAAILVVVALLPDGAMSYRDTTAENAKLSPGSPAVPANKPIVLSVNSTRTNHTHTPSHRYPDPTDGGDVPAPRFSGGDFSRCPDGCSGHGYGCIPQPDGSGICVCQFGYDGDNCGRWVGCHTLNHCSGHGMCVCHRGLGCGCNCSQGWGGADCATQLPSQCPDHCSGRGICEAGKAGFQCACHTGFSGAACERVDEAVCPFSCSGQGECDESAATCACSALADGEACNHAVDACGCLHGACDASVAPPVCKCDPGFRGERCDEYRTELDACGQDHAFCSAHGSCRPDGDGCSCRAGFVEATCGQVQLDPAVTEFCPNMCSGNGRCNVEEKRCHCTDGYAGADCSQAPCPTAEGGLVCNGHGVCEGTQCVCDACFSGPTCEVNAVEQCPGLCNAHGSCVCQPVDNGTALSKCVCDQGWEGEQCAFAAEDKAECCPADCNGNGDCKDCVCECFDAWTGVDCSVQGGGAKLTDGDALDVLADLLQTDESTATATAAAAPAHAAGVYSMAPLWD